MKHTFLFKYISIIALLMTTVSMSAATATEIMNKAAAKAKAAKGISGSFAITSSGDRFNGTLKVCGSKFAFSTPAASSWYNGKNLWTYNASSNETTLVSPTASEIAESNPLEYIRTYSVNYNAVFSNKKLAGKQIITLVPKSRRNTIKTVEITIDNKTLKPERFVMTSKSGVATTIRVKSLDYTGVIRASEFEYPKFKYPKVQIIDLR